MSKNTIEDIEFIDYLFKEYQGEKPSASVMIIKDGEILIAKSYGYANLENKVLATPSTNYRIASVTKQFTAMSIMLLIHRGKLSYSSSLKDIFHEFPDYGKDITIQHLLTHRSGLVKYNSFIKPDQTTQLLDKDVFKHLLETDSTYFKPNTKFAYSNTGYALLSQVVERVSGDSFSNFMDKEIFKPLNMNTSVIGELNKKIENRAYGYLVKDTTVIAKDESITSAIQGDGGVYTSLLDYYYWDTALYEETLLPQDELNKAFCNYDEYGKSNDAGYGYGWKVSYYNGIKILQHGGSSTGFGSHVIRIPSEKISVVIFTNRNKIGQGLAYRANALISHFTHKKIQMPFELIIEKEVEQNGVHRGIGLYHQIKKDTVNYDVSKKKLFDFGIYAINKHNVNLASMLFSVLEFDYPDYFGGYYGKAIIHKNSKNLKQAIEYFEKVIEHCSKDEVWASQYAQEMISQLKDLE